MNREKELIDPNHASARAPKTKTPILIKNLSKRYGSATAVHQISLTIEGGELFFLLGPSGCGKTTLLRMVAGFVQPDSGDILFGKENITSLPPRSRNAGMVFQTYALWPHMTVAKNVAYGLNVRGMGRQEVTQRVGRVLRMVRMEGFEDRRPTQLSGGQQQRVALARALVIEPHVLLLDEPLSNLDARLRDELREEIRRLHHETGLTMIYVTHDQKEALALADRMAVMNGGRLIQVGTPAALYNRPCNRFVAGFLGDSNFIPGKVREGDASQSTIVTPVGILVATPADLIPRAGEGVVCSIRPQALALESRDNSPNQIPARVDQVAFLGELIHLRVSVGETSLTVVSLPYAAAHLKPGDGINLTVAPDQVVLLREPSLTNPEPC